MTLKEIEKRLARIEERNNRVERDKSWETSFERKFLILVLTYFVIGLFMNFIGVDKPFLNAIIPSLGFLLSTLSVPFFKNIWIKGQNKN
jgi:hypothetical protein